MNIEINTGISKLITAFCFIISGSVSMAATLINEDFETWPPANWQVVNYGGAGVWTNHNAIHGWHNYINKEKPISEQGDVAVADATYFKAKIDTALISPALDLTDHSYIVLFFDTVFNYANHLDNYADIDVSTNNGSSWINVLHWEGESQRKYGPGTNININISVAAGCPNALVRFRYFSQGDYYWEIDNVIILADTIAPTEFKAEGVTKNQIDLSWMTNEVGDEVIIARNISDSFGTPTDGTVYNIDNNIGASSVIYKGNETGYSDSNFVFEATEFFYKIWALNSKTQYSEGVSASAASCIATFPYLESFESDFGIWLNIKDNDFDWKRKRGTTLSNLTGPDGGANGSSYYIYTEASSPGNPYKTFLIEDSFDFISAPNPELAFFYHMYGVDMGTLQLDICDESGNWHSNFWGISGQQQTSASDPWKQAIVEMQQFGGQSPVKIRFKGVTGDGINSDIAVDYITITNRSGGLFFSPKTQAGRSNLGTTVKYEINALNLTGADSDFNFTYTGFAGGAGWSETGPPNSGFINYRSSTNFTVTVTIDPNAGAEEAHTSIVTSVSTDGISTNSATIITKCDWSYDLYYEDFESQFAWPNGWTNYHLGQVVEGWFHGIERYTLLWAPAHDPAYGATNWFVSPAINLDSPANQLYLNFNFARDSAVPMDHKQNVYISTGSRDPRDGDFVNLGDINYLPNSATWLYNSYDISAFFRKTNIYIAIDYTSGNPLITFDDVRISGIKTGVDNADIVSPTAFSINSYQSTPAITGSIFIAGSTGTSGPAEQISAQFGYGFRNTNPFDDSNWFWTDANYSGSNDFLDFYAQSPIFFSIAGDFDYAFRFKNGGSDWIYADADGSSNGYSKANAGKMTINSLNPNGELIKEQTLPHVIIAAHSSVKSPSHDFIVADDFEFTVDTKLNSIKWEAIYWGTGRTGLETGIFLKIYANIAAGGDHPGSLIYSELVPGFSSEKFVKEDDGFGINIYEYTINLTTPFAAEKNNKYWIGLQMNTSVSNEFWGQISTPDPISGQSAAQLEASTWSLLAKDIGFNLYGDITNYGTLQGVVSQLYDSKLLPNTTINITDGTDYWATLTDENGEFNIILPLGSYSVSTEINNYESKTVSGISFFSQEQIITQNFSLESAMLYYSPGIISNSVDYGCIVTNKLTITNDGPVALSYNLTITTGTSPAMNLKANKNINLIKKDPIKLNYDLESIFQNCPASPFQPDNKSIEFINQTASLNNNKMADNFDCYAVNINVAPADFVKFNASSPGTFTMDTQLAIDYNELICAGDFLLGDFSTLYAVKFYTRELVKISTTDASITSLGILLPTQNGNEVWTGMTAAPNGDVLGVTTDGSVSRIYNIDIKNCAASIIGTISSQPLVIDIAINTKGELFGIDIINDVLININPETAAPTVIGNIGFNANYAQGLDFNDENGILYFAAYSTNFGGQLKTVNTDTGDTTSIGDFASKHELDALAIPKYVSAAWVSLNQNSGNIPPDSTAQLDVIFDAGAVSNFGTYNSEIIFYGNNINPVPNLTLAMEILQSPIISAPMTQDFGEVELYFTSSVPLIIENSGAGTLTGNVQNISSPFFVAERSNYFIQAGSNITLNTFFVSDVEGDFSQNVLLTGGGNKSVIFKGKAIPEPSLFFLFNCLFLIFLRKK